MHGEIFISELLNLQYTAKNNRVSECQPTLETIISIVTPSLTVKGNYKLY